MKGWADLIEDIPDRLRTAVEGFTARGHEIRADGDLSEQARDRLQAEAREELRRVVADLSAGANEAREKLTGAIAEAEQEHLRGRDTLEELQEQRAWSRALRLLDAGGKPMALIEEAAAAKDRATLAALRAELPAWMTAKSLRAGSDSPPEVGIATLRRAIDEHLTPTLPEPLRTARTAHRKLEDRWPLAEAHLTGAQDLAHGRGSNLERAIRNRFAEQQQ